MAKFATNAMLMTMIVMSVIGIMTILMVMMMMMVMMKMIGSIVMTRMMLFTGFSSGGCISWRTGTSGGLHFC